MIGRNRPAALATTALIVATALIAIVAGSCGSGAGDDVQATDIEFELLDGGTSTIGAFLDRPVVLNFFASWCPPCKAEMPALEAIHQQRPDIAFIGLAAQRHQDPSPGDRGRYRSYLSHWLGLRRRHWECL